jgi:hypothetical protein
MAIPISSRDPRMSPLLVLPRRAGGPLGRLVDDCHRGLPTGMGNLVLRFAGWWWAGCVLAVDVRGKVSAWGRELSGRPARRCVGGLWHGWAPGCGRRPGRCRRLRRSY